MAYGLTEQSVSGHVHDWVEKGKGNATTAILGLSLTPDNNIAQGWV